jgi:Flp pilus assembly pilin Flp
MRAWNHLSFSKKTKSGQGMTEYIIIVCLIAVACLLVVGIFGGNIRELFRSANESLVQGQAQQAQFEASAAQKQIKISDFAD